MSPYELALSVFLVFLLSNVASPLEITVSENGTDNTSCLTGSDHCLTLDYALKVLNSTTYNVSITVTYNHTMESPTHIYTNLHDVTIMGASDDDLIQMTCDRGVGLYITHSTDIAISNIKWSNCSVPHPTSALGNWTYNVPQLTLPTAYSAMFFFNCTNVELNRTSFSSNYGSGVSLYNVLGNVTIANSQFTDHVLFDPCDQEDISSTECNPQSTGLYIELSYCQNMTSYCYPDSYYINYITTVYHIVDSVFQGNINSGAYRNHTDVLPVWGLAREQHWPFGRGGGMGVVVRAPILKWFTVLVEGSRFRDNKAIYGGGMYVELETSFADHWRFGTDNTVFDQNEAYIIGGGLEVNVEVIYYHQFEPKKHLRNHVVIYKSNFTSNTALWGGGLSFVTFPVNVRYLDVSLNDSVWFNNTYRSGAGAIGLLRKERPEQSYHYISKVMFTNCTISHTKPEIVTEKSLKFMSGSIYSEGIPVELYGYNQIYSNLATGMSLSDTGATFFDMTTFYKNKGIYGGAMYLSGKAYMTLTPWVAIEFIENIATQCGGGIYYLEPAPLEMDAVRSCFVWYQNGEINVPLKDWEINVTFVDNTASQSGDAAYVSDLKKCLWAGELSLFNPDRNIKFDYSQQEASSPTYVISTPVKSMHFEGIDNNEHEMMPGDGLPEVMIIALDDLQQSVPVIISVNCYLYDKYLNLTVAKDVCHNNSVFNINGSRLIESKSVLKDLIITGPRNTSDLMIIFRTLQPVSVVLPLHIILTNCNYAFYYDPNGKRCKCSDANPDVILCVTSPTFTVPTPCGRNRYWFGPLPSGSNPAANNSDFNSDDNIMVYQFCHTGKCSNNGSNDSNHSDNKCLDKQYIPVKSSDDLCKNNLTGPLCSKCADDKFLTYNSYSCVDECTIGHKIGLIILMFVECFFIVGVILVFLKLNIRISTAGFYSFLYFYSILPLLLWMDVHPLPFEVLLTIISGITSLDFALLQYAEFCLFDDVMAIHYEVLHYIYPLTVVALVIAIIKFDQHCLRRVQFFTGNSAVQALCIILLISYTSISVTSLRILLPLNYQNISSGKSVGNVSFVYVEPGIEYMDIAYHLPYWLIAFIMEVFIVIPFAIFIFVTPWLIRCVNLTRIKPLLDEYQNCFKDEYRWFAGVYLLARQAFFLVSMVSTNPQMMAYLQQLFCLGLLLFVATLQPYCKKWYNYVDIFFLFILSLLSITGYNATATTTYSSDKAQLAVMVSLSFLPCITVVIGFIIVVIRKCLKRCFKSSQSRRLQSLLGSDYLINSDTHSYLGSSSVDDMYHTEVYTDDERNSDLPPRFYDEEHSFKKSERVKLLQSRQAYSYSTTAQTNKPINSPYTD